MTNENNAKEQRQSALSSQINELLKTAQSGSFLTELEQLILRYSPQNEARNLIENPVVNTEMDDSIQYKPKQYTWFGKFPVNKGTTDWYGYKSPITSGPQSGLKQLANMPIKPYEEVPRSPSQLQRTAIGIIAPGVKSISYFTQMREDTIGSVIEGLPGAGIMHRDAYILESIDYGQKQSDTNELINKGFAWLDPIRSQHLIVPNSYIPKIHEAARRMIEQVFQIVPYTSNGTESNVNKDIFELLKNGETTLRTTSGAVHDRQFWLQNTLLIAKTYTILTESLADWPPTKKPVIVYAELGKDANEQYQRALDLIEVVSILRNAPIRSWATSHVTTEAMHDHIPSLTIVDPRTCEPRYLANINNAQIIGLTNDSNNVTSANLEQSDKLIKTYIRGTSSIDATRVSMKQLLS